MLTISLLVKLACLVAAVAAAPATNQAPPATWKEHWFDHTQEIHLVYSDSDLAVYFDNDVIQDITWPNQYLGDVWRYVKRVYGNFGVENNLYAIFHAGKYSGGHPSTYFDEHHDYRNVIDCGSSSPDAWITGQGNDLDITTHEVAHIVEIASKGSLSSPAFGLWGDSKWAEIFNYDVYLKLGRTADVTRWFNIANNARDNFPRPNTAWFKDWFYPIYSQYGETEVLNQFFTLLSNNFPKNGQTYAREMNWGEFVHFWSGAAGKNLKNLATDAFGWPTEWEQQFNTARANFPGVTYEN